MINEPMEVMKHTASEHFARGIFSLPNLTSLTLRNVGLRDAFFLSMSALAPKSEHFARGIFSLPNLTSLTLRNVGLRDAFFLSMSALAPKSQVKNHYLAAFPYLGLGLGLELCKKVFGTFIFVSGLDLDTSGLEHNTAFCQL